MSLYFWKPGLARDSDKARKHYRDGVKQSLQPPYFCALAQANGISNKELDRHTFEKALRHVRENNLPWGFGTARPKNLAELKDKTYRYKTKDKTYVEMPILDDKGNWRKVGPAFEEEDLQHVVLDLMRSTRASPLIHPSPTGCSLLRMRCQLYKMWSWWRFIPHP